VTSAPREQLARNIVNQLLDGVIECGAYKLVDMKKRQEFNDVADAFVIRLLERAEVEAGRVPH
jgi:hypothetical protein